MANPAVDDLAVTALLLQMALRHRGDPAPCPLAGGHEAWAKWRLMRRVSGGACRKRLS
jgi:hypothetical protein